MCDCDGGKMTSFYVFGGSGLLRVCLIDGRDMSLMDLKLNLKGPVGNLQGIGDNKKGLPRFVYRKLQHCTSVLM